MVEELFVFTDNLDILDLVNLDLEFIGWFRTEKRPRLAHKFTYIFIIFNHSHITLLCKKRTRQI